MNFADCVKETTMSASAAVIVLGGAVTGFLTFNESPLEVGMTGIPLRMEHDAGIWENGFYTYTNANTLTRTEITASSNGGAPAVFPAGPKYVFCTLTAEAAAKFLTKDDGVTLDQLPTFTSAAAGDFVLMYRASDGALGKILASALGGTTTPGDTTAPTITGASVANATPTVVALAVSEALNAAFTPAASAFTVSGHTVTGVTISGSTINLTVSAAFVNGEAARTAGYTQPGTNNARDSAGNLLASFTGRAITNNVAAAGSTVTGVTISPSTANVAGGATQQFTTAVTGTNSPSQGVNLTVSAGSINSSGLFTAPTATGSIQTITITATSQQDGTKSATATVTVAAATTAPTMADTYTATPGINFPASSGYEGGSAPNQYWAQAVNVYIKNGATGAPQSPQILCCWGKSATVPPVSYVGGAWQTQVPFSANGGTSGNVPSAVSGMSLINPGAYPGLFQPDVTVRGGGTPGNYYFCLLYQDGSFDIVQTPVAVS